MVEASLSIINYFMPIFAFLLVFIVIYSILKTTKALGSSDAVALFVSLILASFFIIEASLVEWVKIGGAWMAFGVFVVFVLIVVLGLIPGIDIGKFLGVGGKNWFAWIMFVLVIAFFIISSSYVFNWVVNWGMVRSWFDTEWFGMILLLAIAAVVSWKIKG